MIMKTFRIASAAFCAAAACALHAYEVKAPLLFEGVGVNRKFADFRRSLAQRGIPLSLANSHHARCDAYGCATNPNFTVRLESLGNLTAQPWVYVAKSGRLTDRVLKITLPYTRDFKGTAFGALKGRLIGKYGTPAQLSRLENRDTLLWAFNDGMLILDRFGATTVLVYYSSFGLMAYTPAKRYFKDPYYSFLDADE